MSDTSELQSRIDAEFAAAEQQVKNVQIEALKTYEARQERFKRFVQVRDKVSEVARTRLETLAKRFGDKVKITPLLAGEHRQATLDFQSELARVQLKFSASADTDVRNIVLQYDLEILPILMEFPRHAQAEFPLEAVDPAAVGRWIDDRIIDFVKSYLAMTHNQYYLKGHLVTDPIAGVMFPKFAAAATAERNGNTHYFISEKTRDAFLAREGEEPSAKHSAN